MGFWVAALKRKKAHPAEAEAGAWAELGSEMNSNFDLN